MTYSLSSPSRNDIVNRSSLLVEHPALSGLINWHGLPDGPTFDGANFPHLDTVQKNEYPMSEPARLHRNHDVLPSG